MEAHLQHAGHVYQLLHAAPQHEGHGGGEMTIHFSTRVLVRSGIALALVAGTVASASCVSERSTSASTDTTGCVTPSSAAGLPVVFIRKFAFVPATVHVSAGQSVAWVNCEPDGTPHTATADDASFNSGILHPN